MLRLWDGEGEGPSDPLLLMCSARFHTFCSLSAQPTGWMGASRVCLFVCLQIFGDGVITGQGTINGRQTFVFSQAPPPSLPLPSAP